MHLAGLSCDALLGSIPKLTKTSPNYPKLKLIWLIDSDRRFDQQLPAQNLLELSGVVFLLCGTFLILRPAQPNL